MENSIEQIKQKMSELAEIPITAGDVRRSTYFTDNCGCHIAQAVCRILNINPSEKKIWESTSTVEYFQGNVALFGLAHYKYDDNSFMGNERVVKNNPELPDDHVLETIKCHYFIDHTK